jgi:hypothetical protein
MENVIQLMPNEWVTEEVLISITGWRPGTIKRARENVWLQGREYILFSPVNDPKPNSECMYNRKAIDQWVAGQVKKQPDAAERKKA